jgi:CarD family transcriptional regulator
MEFTVGDVVVHPAYGVGRVENMQDMEYLGQEAKPFYMISIQNGTIWVPAGPEGNGKLRRLTEKTELDEFRLLFKTLPHPLNDDRYQRKLQLSDQLRAGTFACEIEVLRDLTARSWEKSLNENDLAILRKVNDNVCQEWAAAQGISPNDASREIDALLAEARKMSQAPEE